jgi:hypothetical protein
MGIFAPQPFSLQAVMGALTRSHEEDADISIGGMRRGAF